MSFWERFCWEQMLLTLSKVALPSYQHSMALPVCCGAAVCHLVRCSIFTELTIVADLMMIGMMVVLLTTGLWLALATFLELPVSTSHSVGQYLFSSDLLRTSAVLSACISMTVSHLDAMPFIPHDAAGALDIMWMLVCLHTEIC